MPCPEQSSDRRPHSDFRTFSDVCNNHRAHPHTTWAEHPGRTRKTTTAPSRASPAAVSVFVVSASFLLKIREVPTASVPRVVCLRHYRPEPDDADLTIAVVARRYDTILIWKWAMILTRAHAWWLDFADIMSRFDSSQKGRIGGGVPLLAMRLKIEPHALRTASSYCVIITPLPVSKLQHRKLKAAKREWNRSLLPKSPSNWNTKNLTSISRAR
jgi:hypothetical protein